MKEIWNLIINKSNVEGQTEKNIFFFLKKPNLSQQVKFMAQSWDRDNL
jgi:hypothetical protein